MFDHLSAIFDCGRSTLHDSDKVKASDMLHLLIGCIILETWQHNVRNLENRLNYYRHKAIASPNLETFAPLKRLRRSFADIEDAILDAKKFFPFENGHIDFEKLFVNNDAKAAKPERTEVQYDHLLEKIKALSAVLNNEIQLVIGSVTVQVTLDARKFFTLN